MALLTHMSSTCVGSWKFSLRQFRHIHQNAHLHANPNTWVHTIQGVQSSHSVSLAHNFCESVARICAVYNLLFRQPPAYRLQIEESVKYIRWIFNNDYGSVPGMTRMTTARHLGWSPLFRLSTHLMRLRWCNGSRQCHIDELSLCLCLPLSLALLKCGQAHTPPPHPA
jgi:hypothetical protein